MMMVMEDGSNEFFEHLEVDDNKKGRRTDRIVLSKFWSLNQKVAMWRMKLFSPPS